jgi:hypothetical protein
MQRMVAGSHPLHNSILSTSIWANAKVAALSSVRKHTSTSTRVHVGPGAQMLCTVLFGRAFFGYGQSSEQVPLWSLICHSFITATFLVSLHPWATANFQHKIAEAISHSPTSLIIKHSHMIGLDP